MAFRPLKLVAVEQAGDTLTAMFNDGRTVAYSISMLDSEFEPLQDASLEKPVLRKPVQAARWARSKRFGSELQPLRSLRSRQAS